MKEGYEDRDSRLDGSQDSLEADLRCVHVFGLDECVSEDGPRLPRRVLRRRDQPPIERLSERYGRSVVSETEEY